MSYQLQEFQLGHTFIESAAFDFHLANHRLDLLLVNYQARGGNDLCGELPPVRCFGTNGGDFTFAEVGQ